MRARRDGRARPRVRGGLAHGLQAGIITDPVHTKAKIREITPVRVLEALDRGRIVLVAGFQACATRWTSRRSAGEEPTPLRSPCVALGASRARSPDVLGVFTADPRIVPDARKLERVSYEEMLEMSASERRC